MNKQKRKNTSTNGGQKNNFAGTAKKKNRKDKVSQRSLVAVEEKDCVPDSNEDTQVIPCLSLEQLLSSISLRTI
jgi:hypothetical protein